jgi:hypothetical protein
MHKNEGLRAYHFNKIPVGDFAVAQPLSKSSGGYANCQCHRSPVTGHRMDYPHSKSSPSPKKLVKRMHSIALLVLQYVLIYKRKKSC